MNYSEITEKVRQFLQVIIQDNSYLCKFDTFASNLMKVLEKCFISCMSNNVQCRSKCVKREKMWSAFYQLRITKLNKLWQVSKVEPLSIPACQPEALHGPH